MSVNWNWNDKKGEIIWKPRTQEKKEGEAKKRFKWSIYEANCLGCCLYEYKEDNKLMYQFQCFFSDENHLKAMLGLNNDCENLLNEWYFDYQIDYIKLDVSFDNWKLAKAFANAGYQVRLYKSKTN